MFNVQNTHRIDNSIGRCVSVELEQIMHQRSFLQINTGAPLMAGFWWSDSKGQEKWASFKYKLTIIRFLLWVQEAWANVS